MEIFPTRYSTLSAAALNARIQKRYGLSETSCQYLLRGVSDTYLIKGRENKYILKIYRDAHRSLDEIKGEVELLNMLKAAEANVAYPIADVHGEQIQAFNAAEGIRYGVLFSYAIGKSLYDFTDEQLRIIGREMAFNHNITSRIELTYARKSYDLNTTMIQPLKVLAPAFSEYPEGYEYLKTTAEKVIQKMESFHTEAFSYGYCHYDYLPKNFHFDENNKLTVFDFDFAGKGWLANDLMTFQMHYFFHSFFKGIPQKESARSFDTFVEGYSTTRHISEEELAAIPYLGFMFWTFYLGFQYENFDDWSNYFFNTRYLIERVRLIRNWVELYCEF